MRIVDPHHHLWDRGLHFYPWLATPTVSGLVGDTTPLCQNYLLADFMADAAPVELVKSVHLQADTHPTSPLRKPVGCRASPMLPAMAAFRTALWPMPISAIRGSAAYWRRTPPSPTSAAFAKFSIATRIRASTSSTTTTSGNAWQEGIGRLRVHGLSFDMQLDAPQMSEGAATARRHVDTQIIINHTGMPADRDPAGLAARRGGMRALAACPNVAVKISGLGMVDHHWTVESIRPFVLETIDLFGTARCLFASNFPVDKLFSDYASAWRAFHFHNRRFLGERARRPVPRQRCPAVPALGTNWQAVTTAAAPKNAAAQETIVRRARRACAGACGSVGRPRPSHAPDAPTASRSAGACASRGRGPRAASSSSARAGPDRHCCREPGLRRWFLLLVWHEIGTTKAASLAARAGSV